MNPESSSPRIADSNAPEPLIGLAKLMRMAYSGVDLAPLGTQLVARAEAATGKADANAFMDLSTVLQLRGDRDLAMTIQAQALEIQQLYSPPTAAGANAIRVLALMGPGDLMSNTPLEFLLENSNVALDLLYVSPHLPLPAVLPEHEVLFVAIGESEDNLPLLKELEAILQSWPRPVLNLPGRITRLSRDSACALLRPLAGLVMPDTARIGHDALKQVGLGKTPVAALLEDGRFPLIVRPVDSHAGKDLVKLDHPSDITAYQGAVRQDAYFISRFIDYSGKDGLFRKYRIVLIDGRPFVCHMAISSHWMIHYLNAGMADSAEKRAEEAHFMEHFDEDFARRHADVFKAIHQRMGLDYLGIDCAETADGQLLVFEVDSNMIVHALDPVDVFPYKQPQMRKVFAAFHEMLLKAANRTPHTP